MQKQNSIRVLELLKYLYLRTDEEHPATIADMLDYLKGKGIHAVRQTVYGDLQDLIASGIDVVVIKSTQNQYFIGARLFEYPELKMLTDAVASSKVISADKTNELIQKLCRLTSESEAEKLQRLAAISSRIKPHNEKVYYIIDGSQPHRNQAEGCMWIPEFLLRPDDLHGSAPFHDAYGNIQSGSSDRFSIPERRGPAYRNSHHV